MIRRGWSGERPALAVDAELRLYLVRATVQMGWRFRADLSKYRLLKLKRTSPSRLHRTAAWLRASYQIQGPPETRVLVEWELGPHT